MHAASSTGRCGARSIGRVDDGGPGDYLHDLPDFSFNELHARELTGVPQSKDQRARGFPAPSGHSLEAQGAGRRAGKTTPPMKFCWKDS